MNRISKSLSLLTITLFSTSLYAQSIQNVVLDLDQPLGITDCIVKKAVEITRRQGDDFLVKVILRGEETYPVVRSVSITFKTENKETWERKVFKIFLYSTSSTGWKLAVTNGSQIGFFTPLMSIKADLKLLNSTTNLSTLDVSSCRF